MKIKGENAKDKLSEQLRKLISIIEKFQSIALIANNDLRNVLKPKLETFKEFLSETLPWLDHDAYAVVYDRLQCFHGWVEGLEELKSRFVSDKALIGNIKVSINKSLESLRKDIETNLTYTKKELEEFEMKTVALKDEQLSIVETEVDQALVDVLKKVAKIFGEKLKSQRVFFSYAWPTPENKNSEEWVGPFLKNLYRHFKAAGLKPIMDLMDMLVGGNIYQFMSQARTSEYVLLFCTPSLLHKHSDPAWYAVKTELSHIDSKHNLDLHTEQVRIIPMQLMGTHINSFPEKYKLNSNVLDWRDAGYAKSLEKVIGQIYFGSEADFPAEYKECWQPFHELGEVKKRKITDKMVI